MRKLPTNAMLAAFAVAAFSVSVTPSSAADLGGYKDTPEVQAYPEPVTWSGFYVGVNAGAAINNSRTSYSYGYAPGNSTNNFSDFFGNAADNAGGSESAGPLNVGGLNAVQSAQAEGFLPAFLGSGDTASVIGGGQLGYNWQLGHLVLGGETDFNWIGKGSSHSFSETIPGAYTNAGGDKSSVEWLGTARLRAGYAFDRLLPYVTAGLAYGGTKASSYSTGTDGDTVDTFSGSDSSTRTGWAAGAGLDYWLGNKWSFRFEALYYDLGKARYTVSPQDANSAAEGLSVTAQHKFDGAVVRAALNHSF